MEKAKKLFAEATSIFSTGLGRKIVMPLLVVVMLLTVPLFLAFRVEAVADKTQLDVDAENQAIQVLQRMQVILRNEQIAISEIVYENRANEITPYQAAYAEAETHVAELFNHEHAESKEFHPQTDDTALIEQWQALHRQNHEIVNTQIIPAVESQEADMETVASAEIKVWETYPVMNEISSRLYASFEEHRANIQQNRTWSR